MLYKLKNAKKIENGNMIEWFTDKYFDLAVWFDKKKNIIMFQLSYDKFKNERTLTWNKDKGYSHNKIDDGEIAGRHKKSPILIPDGEFSKESIAKKFKTESREIDSKIADFVYEKIIHYSS